MATVVSDMPVAKNIPIIDVPEHIDLKCSQRYARGLLGCKRRVGLERHVLIYAWKQYVRVGYPIAYVGRSNRVLKADAAGLQKTRTCNIKCEGFSAVDHLNLTSQRLSCRWFGQVDRLNTDPCPLVDLEIMPEVTPLDRRYYGV